MYWIGHKVHDMCCSGAKLGSKI